MGYDIANLILVGDRNYPLYRFDNSDIVLDSLRGVFAVDVIGNELSVDTVSVTIRHDPGGGADDAEIYAPIGADGYKSPDSAVYSLATQPGRDYMTELPYGTPVFWYCGGEFFTKGYLRSVERLSRRAWKLTLISGVGLLDNSYHVGGIYSGATAGEIITDIVGGVISMDIDNTVASVSVNGWLPYDTRRANLHQILFAIGASLIKGDADTDYRVVFLRNEEHPAEIPASRVDYRGKVQYVSPATAAEVTEYSFFSTGAEPAEVLFDNSLGGQTDNFVVFASPCYDLAATGGLTIIKSGANYARVSGNGILTGKKYTQTSTTVTERIGGAKPLVKRVTGKTLVSPLNSVNVARRVLAFFSSAKTISAKIALENEKPGDQLQFLDAFGDPTLGFMTKMTFGVTSIRAAQCDFIEGYTPTGQGNYYSHRVLISASGTWTVPQGVSFVRIVLIGGGSGGSGGYDGADGQGYESMQIFSSEYRGWRTQFWQYKVNDGVIDQHEAAGGNAGEAGLPGKFFSADYAVSAGETLTFSVGAGGAGGAGNGGAGSDGTATSVSSVSVNATSADGVVPQGYSDPFTGELYSVPGEAGHPGANGGMTDVNSLLAYQGFDGYPGHDFDEWHGGAGGAGFQQYDEDTGIRELASGGGGGGAAYGADGADGGTRTTQSNIFFGGAGGAGADAVAPSVPTYGCGGGAGNGGGGGGNAAAAYVYYNENQYTIFAQPGVAGVGGKGSDGGQGGAGCAIIYY